MKAELQFLITCCKTNPTEEDINFIRSQLPTDHPTLKTDHCPLLTSLSLLAHAHGIFPLFYQSLKTHASDLIREDTLQELKQQYMAIVQHNMMMTAELIHIMKLLQENGIEALAFKGPVLAQMAYGDITLRQYSDLDVLVKEKQLFKTAQLLVKQHYDPMDSIEFLKNEAKLHIEKNYEFYKQTNSIKLEIHWRLINTFLLKKFKNYNFWESSQAVIIKTTSIPTLDKNILLLYLCNHGAAHMWERIEWIADLDRLIVSSHQSLDWNEILNLGTELQSKTTLLLGLGLTKTLFNTTFPENIEKELNTNSAVIKLFQTVQEAHNSEWLYDVHTSNEKNLKVFRFHLALQDSLSTKLGFIFQTMFGYSDRDVMMLNLPRSLFFLYYPLRIGRIIKKYTLDPVFKRLPLQ